MRKLDSLQKTLALKKYYKRNTRRRAFKRKDINMLPLVLLILMTENQCHWYSTKDGCLGGCALDKPVRSRAVTKQKPVRSCAVRKQIPVRSRAVRKQIPVRSRAEASFEPSA